MMGTSLQADGVPNQVLRCARDDETPSRATPR